MINDTLVNRKSYKYLLNISIYTFLAAFAVFGQYIPNPDQQQAIDRRKQEKDLETNRVATDKVTRPGNNSMENELKSESEILRRRAATREASREIREDRKRITALRTPNSEDVAEYKEFLDQPKTGLFRLFSDLGCETKNIVRVDGDCANAVTSSWAYSFRRKNYIPDFLDIRLKDDNLIADGFLSQEILVSLGDVPLEKISLLSSGMKFLVGFTPETPIKDATRQFNEIAKTIDAGGYKYGKNLRAELNTTYAARIIAYRNDDKKLAHSSLYKVSVEEKKFWYLKDDKRIDLTIAFRIIRKDADGNITILWKELARQNAPRLVFTKDEKLSDIK